MSDFDDVLVSRADIARLAGVRRPAVTNWERRHGDFPDPVADRAGKGDGVEVFRAVEVLAWLERRSIPANARRSEEAVGTTYGDRFRTALGGVRAGALLKAVHHLAGPEAERFRGDLSLAEYVTVLLSLVYVRACRPDEWRSLTAEAEAERYHSPHSGESFLRILGRAVEQGLGVRHDELFPAFARMRDATRVADSVRRLDACGPVEQAEHAQAFDWLLARYGELAGRTAGDFFTPRAAAGLLSKFVTGDAQDVRSVHDPFVRAGELLSAALDAVAEARGEDGLLVASGAGVGEHPLALAGMNLALRGRSHADLRSGRVAPSAGSGPGHRAFDRIIANPPFNARLPEQPAEHRHWLYGPPPRHNANFDWLQYVVASLAPEGRAAVLMPDIAAFSSNPSERRIRAAMVEDGAVEALIALPSHLFTTTSISVTIWVLRHPRGRCEEVLFVDARRFGSMTSPGQRALGPDDTDSIFRQYESWFAARAAGRPYAGVPGVSRSVPLAEIRERDHTLSPAVHLSSGVPYDPAPLDPRKLHALAGDLAEAHARAREADTTVDELLRRYGL
ncbi:N-6 DNA methylase [Streptomyces spongiae]|uniref:N-6 DNA methylase n=1 Tax=Streptomyces spongiae TaxID=565072 RepID=A0A5N8XRR2_9ACTN|nr:N-6 DNA methylase [Streptomyces spongiae]MPY62103.1 N-6 DNA methylase [Streptomyces spongiae]